jgi:phage portal protein BeeE
LSTRRSNDTQNAFDFRDMFIAHCALRGDVPCQIVAIRDSSMAALNPIDPDTVRVGRKDDLGVGCEGAGDGRAALHRGRTAMTP